jgi:hypothetical protein
VWIEVTVAVFTEKLVTWEWIIGTEHHLDITSLPQGITPAMGTALTLIELFSFSGQGSDRVFDAL